MSSDSGFKRKSWSPESVVFFPSNESEMYRKLSTTQYTDVESFDCPVCYSMILPPIRTICKNLHIVCNNCIPQLGEAICPKCRLPLLVDDESRRSYELEQILKTLLTNSGTRSCRYSDYGCRVKKDVSSWEQLIFHERTCQFRWIKLANQLQRLYDEHYIRLQNKSLRRKSLEYKW